MEIKKEFEEPIIKKVVIESLDILCASPAVDKSDFEGPGFGDSDGDSE